MGQVAWLTRVNKIQFEEVNLFKPEANKLGANTILKKNIELTAIKQQKTNFSSRFNTKQGNKANKVITLLSLTFA